MMQSNQRPYANITRKIPKERKGMKIKFKKKLIIFLSLMLLISAALCSCTTKNGKDKPSGQGEGTKKLYVDFLKNELSVSIKDYPDIADGDYTAQQLLNALHDNYNFQWGTLELGAAEYAYIDCGLDSEPELALSFIFRDTDGYNLELVEYIVIKNIAGNLKFITSESGYYESVVSLNKAGCITFGGGNGIGAFNEAVRFVKADGSIQPAYSRFTEVNLKEPIITNSNLTRAQLEKMSVDMIEYDYPGYSCEIYNFDSLNYEFGDDFDNEEYEKEVDRYNAQNMYSFKDSEGKSVMPSDAYLKLCADNGVKVYSADKMSGLLSERLLQIGLTQEIISAGEPEWAPMEGVKDMLSVKAQIKTFVENKNLWYQKEADVPDGSYVYYAVADLDRNGRYEIIRVRKTYEPEDFSKNNFFEITEDFSGVYEEKYDAENLRIKGDDTVYAPDIFDMEYLECFYTFDWTSDFGSQNTEYFYWIPDTVTNKDGSTTRRNMTLCADNTGEISARAYSLSKESPSGVFKCFDAEGNECELNYFLNESDITFPNTSGWYMDEVTLEFVILLDKDSDEIIEEQLAESLGYMTVENVFWPIDIDEDEAKG